MASTLKINTLTGVTTAGSIAVTGEGNSTTTNLQQGLTKYSGVWDSKTDNTLRDSFNVSGVTDNATGDFTVTFTNAMGNAFYSALGNVSGENNVYGVLCSQDTHATTGCGYQSRDISGTTTDVDKNSFAGVGDLA
jgi:hypothetical protein